MKFSIIIPNYNKEIYIKECLDSITNQTLDKSKYEVIFVDDGSTDNSLEIASKYDIKILHSNRLRSGGARNLGISASKGEYLIFIDSDDYLSNNTVLEKLDKLIKSEDIIYFNYTKIFLDNSTTEIIQDVVSLKERIETTKFLGVPTYCVKRSIVSDLKFLEKCTYEDVLFTMTVLCKCTSEAYFNESFFTYRKVENSNTTTEVGEKQMIDLIIQISSMHYLCLDYPQYKNEILKRINNDKLEARVAVLNELMSTGINRFEELIRDNK